MRHIYVAILLITLIGSVAGCHRQPSTDPRIAQVEEILNRIDPPADSALNMLDCIAEPLSSRDRALKAMLTVKANDKAYHPLTSDSLILTALDYFERHPSDSLPLAESLYYGGRVAVSMGDYPAALAYFRRALAHLPASPSTLRLKGLILYHTAFTFNKLRLNKEAIPYLKQSLEIDRALNNPSDEISDLLKLGFTYANDKSFNEAEYFYRLALELGMKLTPEYRAAAREGIAYVKLLNHQPDSALIYIRPAIDSVSPKSRVNALTTACQIYYQASIPDTAFIYAKELLSSSSSTNRHIAYSILLSDLLLPYSSTDSILEYVRAHTRINQELLERNKIEIVSHQDNYYRYSSNTLLREKESQTVLHNHTKRVGLICAIVFASLLSAICMIFLRKYRGLKKETQRQLSILETSAQSFEHIYEKLNQEISILKDSSNQDTSNSYDRLEGFTDEIAKMKEGIEIIIANTRGLTISNANESSETILNNILDRYNNGEKPAVVNALRNSAVAQQLQHFLENNKLLSDESPIWDEIEKTIAKVYPNFKVNLSTLSGRQVTRGEWEFANLVKMGLNSREIGQLLSKSRGAVGSRAATLHKKIVSQHNIDISIVDIILLL